MDNSVRIVILVVVVVVIALGGAVLLTGVVVPNETGPIAIGFIAPLTGDVASIGTVAKAGAELAVEEINAVGGINGRLLNIVYEDGQCSATEASNAANKLMNIDKVVAILGGACSGETSAFAPAAMQNKTIVLSYCSSAPNLTGTGPYFFRNYPSDLLQGKIMAEYAYNTMGARDVAILYHISDWGTGLKDVFSRRFQELGGTIVLTEGAQQDSRDYRSALTKIKSSSAKHIYAPTYTEGSIVAMKQAKELGVTAQLIGGDTWDDPKFQDSVRNLGTFIYPKISTPPADAFNQRVAARSGVKEVPICATQAYDSVRILAEAIEKSGTDSEKLANALRETKYDGVSGHVEFDENGDMKGGSYIIRRIEGGKAETLSE